MLEYYAEQTRSALADDEVLLCCAVPAAEKGQSVMNISLDL